MSDRGRGATGKMARTDTEPDGARPSHAADQPPTWAQLPAMDVWTRASLAGQLAEANTRAAQAIWREVPGTTKVDRTLALAPNGAVLPELAVARASALVEAARRRPRSVPDDRWQRHLPRVWDGLTEDERQDPEMVLNAVLQEEAGERAARRLRKTRHPSGRPPVDREERFRAVEAAVNALREEEGFDAGAFGDLEEFRQEAYQLRLTRKAIAARLGRHPATLRRWGYEDPGIAEILDTLP